MNHCQELAPSDHERAARLLERVAVRNASEASQCALPSTAGIVLRHGSLFTEASTVPEELRGEAGHCYRNTLLAALAGDGWSYCEGFAYVEQWSMTVEHAWLVNNSGQVLEPTWPSVAGTVYLGVAYATAQVSKAMQQQAGGVLFSDYARGFQLHRSHVNCCTGQG